MAKLTVTRTDGVKIEVEGTAEDLQKLWLLAVPIQWNFTYPQQQLPYVIQNPAKPVPSGPVGGEWVLNDGTRIKVDLP